MSISIDSSLMAQNMYPQNDVRRIQPQQPEEGTAPDEKAPKARPADKDEYVSEETCTGNTDKVDAEIRKLKKKEAELKEKLSRAGDDPEEQERLKSELMRVQSELRMKDNDSYRRQHTEFR